MKSAILQIVEEHRPLTIRHLFYLMVGNGLINKTEDDYNNVTIRLTGDMREDWWARELGEIEDDGSAVIPFGKEYILDAGRWIRKPATHNSMEDALRDTAQFYRRDMWGRQNAYVTFFSEKDAIAELIYQVTSEYDVPLAVMRGECSKTFLWENAGVIKDQRKPTFLYFLGDADVKGRQIIESATARIKRYAPNADIKCEILAVTERQIKEYNLPTRPEKTDRTKRAVEIDALPPEALREIIKSAINRHIDQRKVDDLKVVEDNERAGVDRILNLPQVKRILDSV